MDRQSRDRANQIQDIFHNHLAKVANEPSGAKKQAATDAAACEVLALMDGWVAQSVADALAKAEAEAQASASAKGQITI